LGLAARSVGAALASCEAAAGPLLRECQGQADLALVRRCAFKLAGRMELDGRRFVRPLGDDPNIRDAIGAGLRALVVWRAGAGVARDADGGERVEFAALPAVGQADAAWQRDGERVEYLTAAARVAWRAVVESISADTCGESVPLSSIGEDWLASVAMPGESRAERLARLKVERMAAGRAALLVRRVEAIKASGGRVRRSADKIGHAAALLLAGEPLDAAAAAAGFKASAKRGGRGGGTSAGDRLCQALRRCGVRVVASQRLVSSFLRDEGERRAPDDGRRFQPAPQVETLPMVTMTAAGYTGAGYVSARMVRCVRRTWRATPAQAAKDERRRVRRAWMAAQRFNQSRGAAVMADTGKDKQGRNWFAHIRASKPAARGLGHFTGAVCIGRDGIQRRAVLTTAGAVVYV